MSNAPVVYTSSTPQSSRKPRPQQGEIELSRQVNLVVGEDRISLCGRELKARYVRHGSAQDDSIVYLEIEGKLWSYQITIFPDRVEVHMASQPRLDDDNPTLYQSDDHKIMDMRVFAKFANDTLIPDYDEGQSERS